MNAELMHAESYSEYSTKQFHFSQTKPTELKQLWAFLTSWPDTKEQKNHNKQQTPQTTQRENTSKNTPHKQLVVDIRGIAAEMCISPYTFNLNTT